MPPENRIKSSVEQRVISAARSLAEKLNKEIEKGNATAAFTIALLLAGFKDFLDIMLDLFGVGEVPGVNFVTGLFLTSFLFFFLLKKGWFLKTKIKIWFWLLGLVVDGLPLFSALPINVLLVLYAWRNTKKRAANAKIKLVNLSVLSRREIEALNNDISLLETKSGSVDTAPLPRKKLGGKKATGAAVEKAKGTFGLSNEKARQTLGKETSEQLGTEEQIGGQHYADTMQALQPDAEKKQEQLGTNGAPNDAIYQATQNAATARMAEQDPTYEKEFGHTFSEGERATIAQRRQRRTAEQAERNRPSQDIGQQPVFRQNPTSQPQNIPKQDKAAHPAFQQRQKEVLDDHMRQQGFARPMEGSGGARTPEGREKQAAAKADRLEGFKDEHAKQHGYVRPEKNSGSAIPRTEEGQRKRAEAIADRQKEIKENMARRGEQILP